MKYFMFILAFLFLLAPLAAQADESDTLDSTWNAKKPLDFRINTRAKLQDATNQLRNIVTFLVGYKTQHNAQWNALPADLKTAYTRWFMYFKDSRDAIEADAVIQLINSWMIPAP